MQRIGRYELGEVLGRGGAGTVYRAIHHGPGGLRRTVALKVLNSGGDGLQREARIGGLLRHRNLVDVYEIGEADGQWFCAMEHCARGSLSAWLPLPPRAVVEVGLQVCAALAYAHADLGLVHLDIKPDNLLLTADGTVKLADLGIARAEGFELDGIRGTHGYMAPERRAGLPVDARADQYALGATLVHLATGAVPGASETVSMETLDAEDEGATVPLEPTWDPGRTVGPGPGWLLPVVGRCLETDPQHRWPDLEAVATALRALRVTGPGLAEVLGVVPDAPESADRLRPVDGLIGRDAELEALDRRLSTGGVVAVVGPPGVGKSALARQAAWATGLRGWACDLAEATTPADVLARVVRAVGLPPGSGGEPGLLRVLAREPTVLVLDHGERVDGLESLVQRWVAGAPALRVLLPGRRDRGLPDPLVLGPLAEAPAVALLAARARTRGVELGTDPDLPALAKRLDGLPLALELAAGRLGVLSVADVLERLDQGVLRAGSGGRHDTLETALTSSWEGLDPATQQALVQLTVFVGGFFLDAAESVLGAHTLDALDTLTAHSLVVRQGERLALPASVRDFAASRGPTDEAERRHGVHFAALGSAAGLRSLGAVSRRQQRARVVDLDNLLAAARRAMARKDRPVAEATTLAAWKVMRISGPHDVAVGLLERALHADPDSIGLTYALSEVRLRSGVPTEATALLERSLAAARATGDRWQEGAALGGLGRVAQLGHRLEEAMAHHRAALVIHEQVGTEHAVATCLANLGTLTRMAGDPEEGERLLLRALAHFRALEDPVAEAETLGNLASLLSEAGRLEEAVQRGEQALRTARALDYRPFEGFLLGNLGEARQLLGHPEAARADLEAAIAIHRELGSVGYEGHYQLLLGDLERTAGRTEAAAARYAAALPLLVRAEDRVGQALLACGQALLAVPTDPDAARAHQERARELLAGVELPPAVTDRFEAIRQGLAASE